MSILDVPRLLVGTTKILICNNFHRNWTPHASHLENYMLEPIQHDNKELQKMITWIRSEGYTMCINDFKIE